MTWVGGEIAPRHHLRTTLSNTNRLSPCWSSTYINHHQFPFLLTDSFHRTPQKPWSKVLSPKTTITTTLCRRTINLTSLTKSLQRAEPTVLDPMDNTDPWMSPEYPYRMHPTMPRHLRDPSVLVHRERIQPDPRSERAWRNWPILDSPMWICALICRTGKSIFTS